MKIETLIDNKFTRISMYDSYGDILTSRIVQNKSIQKMDSSNIIGADAKLSEIQEQQIVSDDDFILSILYPTSERR